MAAPRAFVDECRKNWGYWDGHADRKAGRVSPPWAPDALSEHEHPLDPNYGAGYWAGFHGRPHPVSGKLPEAA